MALDYKDVLDIYDDLHRGDETLPQFAQRMNERTGTQSYSAGLRDDIVKRWSARIDQAIDKTGIPEYGAKIGRPYGAIFGDPEAGEEVGRSLGRMSLNFAPLLIPGVGEAQLARIGITGAAVPLAQAGLTAARYGGTAALSGAETYEKTDSPLAGLVSAATAVALPKVADVAGQFAGQQYLKRAGGRLVEGPLADLEGNITQRVKSYFPTTPEQVSGTKLAAGIGGQVGAAGLFGASGAAQELIAGQPVTNPLSTANLISLTLGQAPFAAIHLGGKALGIGKPLVEPDIEAQANRLDNLITLSKARISLAEAKKDLENKPDIDKVPLVDQPVEVKYETLRAKRQLLAEVRSNMVNIKNDPNLTDEQKVEQTNIEMNRDFALGKELDILEGRTTFGDRIAPDSPRQELLGRQIWTNKDGTARAIQVANHPDNPQELWGKIIQFSTLHEKPPVFGIESMEGGGTQFEPGAFAIGPKGRPVASYPMGRYNLPDVQWRTIKTLDEWNARYKKDESGQPVLPVREGVTDEAYDLLVNVERGGQPQIVTPGLERIANENGIEVTSSMRPMDIIDALKAKSREASMSTEELNAYMHEFDSVSDKVDAANTTGDLHLATVELNSLEAHHDLTQTNDAGIKTEVERLTKEGVEPDKVVKTALKAKVAKAKRKVQAKEERIEDVRTAGEFYAEQLELAKTDPVVEEEMGSLDLLQEQLKTKRSKYTDELLGGELFRMYKDWVDSGRKGGLVKFAKDVWSTARTGEGLIKETPSLDEVSSMARQNDVGKNLVEEAARVVTANSREAEATFNAWAKLHPDETTFEQDKNLFHEIVGQVGTPKDLTPEELQDFATYWSNAVELPEQEVKDEVNALLKRPHVIQWTNELESYLTARREKNAAPEHKIVRPAGNKFLFAMAPYDPVTNKLGGKHTLPRNSIIDEATFQKIGGVGKPLNTPELNLYKLIAPEAFEGGKVNVAFLDKALKTKGPIVETFKMQGESELGTGVATINQRNQYIHELETAGYRPVMYPDGTVERLETTAAGAARNVDWEELPQNLQQIYDNLLALQPGHGPEVGTAQYGFIGPKEQRQMPGYVEGLVRLPEPTALKGVTREKATYYTGPHFGAEDTNVLAFFRGYEETLPNGEKAFHVIEVQSDWGQKVREQTKQLEKARKELNQNVTETMVKGKWHYFGEHYTHKTLGLVEAKTKEEAVQKFLDKLETTARELGPPAHPLLDVYNNLALKAAVQHAKDIGATKLILSDAETAMMTEGHDRAQAAMGPLADETHIQIRNPDDITKIDDFLHTRFAAGDKRFQNLTTDVSNASVYAENASRQEAERQLRDLAQELNNQGLHTTYMQGRYPIPQEKGMRLNYDQKLPSAMEKLTGQKGEPVDLGVHKSTLGDNYSQMGRLDVALRDGRITQQEYDDGIQALREGRPIGSPVFKTAEGTPKTNITGRAYDISNVPGELTLTEPTRAPEHTPGEARFWDAVTKINNLGYEVNLNQATDSYYVTKNGQPVPVLVGSELHGLTNIIKNGPPKAKQWTPQSPEEVAGYNKLGLADGGRGMLNFLLQSKNPIFSALARDLTRFQDGLQRIAGQIVGDINTGGHILTLPGERFMIELPPSILNDPVFEQEFSVAHELVHGLSLTELKNPTNAHVVTALENLRVYAAGKLPPKMKEAYRRAIETNWLRRYSNGTAEYKDLMPDGTFDQRNTLYGLMDTGEFVAQGLSENIFREYLKSIPGLTKSETGFRGFTNLIKQLLKLGQDVSSSAFEEFLGHTNQLMRQHDSVASFRNFSDRYFEGLGMGPNEVYRSTNRATSLIKSVFPLESAADVLQAVRGASAGARSPEWTQAYRDVQRMFNRRDEDTMTTQSLLDEVGHRPDDLGLVDLADSLMSGKIDPDILDTMPEPAFKFVRETVQDVRNIVDAVHGAVQDGNKGVLNVANPEILRGVMGETLAGIDAMVEQSRLHDEKVKDIQQLFQVPPDGFYDNITKAPEVVPEFASGQDKKSWFDSVSWFLAPIGQLARSIPEAAEAFARGWQLSANQRKMASEALKVFGMDLSNMTLTEQNIKDFKTALTDQRLVDSVNKWIFENQSAGKRTGETRVIDADDPRIVNIIGKLSAKERGIVEDIVNKHQISMQHMQEQILEKGLQISSTNGAIIAQRSTNGKLKDAVTLSETLLRAFTADRSDPNAAALADAQIHSVEQRMTPDGFLDLARYTKSAAETWKLQKEWFNANPAWSSAQRYGKYLMEFKKNGRTFLLGVDSKKEADTIAGGRPYKFEPNRQHDEDRPPVLGPDAVGVVNKMRELEQNQRDMLQNTGQFTPDQIEEMKRTSPSEQFATLETYRGGVPGLTPPPRGLTKGASELPWLKNHFSWVTKTSNYWSRQLLRAQARAHLLDPEITQNEELRRNLQTHYENILQPDTQFGRLAQRTVMTWFMGFNPASALINGTQPFLTHVAELTAMSGKPLDSYRRVLGALKEIYSGGLTKGEWKDPEIAQLMHRASLDGELDYSMYDEVAAAQETLHTNYKRILQGNQPQTTGQRLSTMAGNLSNWGMMMFRTVERINNMSALISSYRYIRESRPNLSLDEAYAKAVEFNHAVNFGGGRAQRPIGAFAGRGAFPRSVAMLATAMQSYNLGTTFQIARYIRAGLFRPAGLSPAEVYNARKALVQMGSTQLALAGVLGLPFVSGMLAILNQAFPDLELNKKLREGMNTVLGGDEENGSILTDIAMTGAPSMMGWDLQSRLSMGNTVPGVSEVNGFQPENLLGAPANLVSNFVRGGQKLASGDYPRAIDAFMPSALKKFEQLLRSGGQVLDYRDRPIFTPTLGEKVGIGLGFQPKRLSDYNRAERIARQADDNIKRREGQFHQQMASEVLKGNFGSVRQSVIQRTRENEKYNPQEAIRAIASAAEELTFPRDLRREGTARGGDIRSKLLSSFNIPPTQTSEVDRLKFRQGVEQRLGLVTQSSTGLTTAAVMDQLRRQNPNATRADLRQQATLLLHGRRPQMPALPVE